ncbi:MAG: hypothetical protein ABR507_01675 [Actinomycetota bacterium]
MTSKKWNRSVKLWWLGIAGWGTFLVAAQVMSFWDIKLEPIVFFTPALFLFYSGYFYSHRLRQLGTQSANRNLREPAEKESQLHNTPRQPTAFGGG